MATRGNDSNRTLSDFLQDKQSASGKEIITIKPKSFPTSVLGVWRFNSTLSDEVEQNDFVPSTGSSEYAQFNKFELIPNEIQTRSGLKFEQDKSYSVSPSYTYPNDFTMSFWWFSPGLVGFTRHVTTRDLEPKVAPIIAKSDSAATSDSTTLSNSSFVVTETAYSKTKNTIKVYLSTNGANVSHIVLSESYEPGLHHVLITYIKSQGRLRIDIDGKTGIMHSAPVTSLERAGDFRINSVAPGFLAHKTTQVGGYLFDLVFTTYASQDNEALKAFRYGYEHISYNELFDTRFSYFGLSYAQPATISTTHMFVDGGNIFAARSNGEIVKGDRAIWDKEFGYKNPKDVSLLTTSQVDNETSTGETAVCGDSNSSSEMIKTRIAQWTNQGLCVRGSIIRI